MLLIFASVLTLCRETVAKRSFSILLKLNLSDGCACSYTSIDFPVDFQVLVLY